MNLKEEKYNKFALVREMMQTPDIIQAFDPGVADKFLGAVKSRRGLFLTGEGSSRIFPAKRSILASLKWDFSKPVTTEGSTQAEEYNLKDFAVFAASNSGQTKEVIRLASLLKKQGHGAVFGLTANPGTKLEELADKVAEEAYKRAAGAQPGGPEAGGGPEPGGPKKPDEDVVDADFEEVKK